MSQYGEGDWCSVWSERWVKAKKHHTCHACQETIGAGHDYHVTFTVFEGKPNTTKRCVRCQAIYAHLTVRLREDGDYDEFCDARLACGHEYKERWNEEPSPEIAALAFALPGELSREAVKP